MRLRSRSAAVAMLAGVVALALAGCSPEEPGPTASPTSASSTPTQVETTSSPTPTPSPTPTLTQEEVHVAEATETFERYIAAGVTIANNGGAGGEAIQPFLGTDGLRADYSNLWQSMQANGGYTTGSSVIVEVTNLSYDPSYDGGPALTLSACLDHSAVTQFDSAGTAFPAPGATRPILLSTWQLGEDGLWRLLAESASGETC